MKVLQRTGRRKMRKKMRKMKKRKMLHISNITNTSLCRKRSSTWNQKKRKTSTWNQKKRKTLHIWGLVHISNITHITNANLARSSSYRIWDYLLLTCSSPAIDWFGNTEP